MFALTCVLNLISSYLFASVAGSFLVIFIAFFALVIFNLEFLSLFSAMTSVNTFIFSIINFIIASLVFKYKNASFLKPNFDFKRFLNALKLDKSLIVSLIAFISLISVSLFFVSIMPVLEPDSQTYHFMRAYEFVHQKSLQHFEINDVRALVMPINSEIFYSFMLMFKKNFYGYGVLSFCAYILSIISAWDIFEKFKWSFRKRIFAIFVFSSFPAVILQIPSLQTDLVVGALLISSAALFFKKKIYFSSLALAIALGVKSTAIMALLAMFALFVLFEILIEKNKKITCTKRIIPFLILNFFIFSSYNYILNFIQFQNPISNVPTYIAHRFWGGIEGYISNLINYFFQTFDFTGFKWGFYLNDEFLQIRDSVFKFLHINSAVGCNTPQEQVNIIVDEQIAGFGILGFLVYLPMVFVSIFRFFKNKNKRTTLVFIFAICFLINILVLARSVAYMQFSVRFIVSFATLSSIILIGVYKKKFLLKPVLLFFILFYMGILPYYNKRMPFGLVYRAFKEVNFNKSALEEKYFRTFISIDLRFQTKIYDTIKKRYSDKKNIAILKKTSSLMLYLKKLEYEGYNVDFLVVGDLNEDKIKQYDLIITEGIRQDDNIFNFKHRIEVDYKKIGDNIVFSSSKKYNCYYTHREEQPKESQNIDMRFCFTYHYLKQKENLVKLDYAELLKYGESEDEVKIYYFISHIKD